MRPLPPRGRDHLRVRAREAPFAYVSGTPKTCTDSKLQTCRVLRLQSSLRVRDVVNIGGSGMSNIHPSPWLKHADHPPTQPENSFPCIVVGSTVAPPAPPPEAQRARASLPHHAGGLRSCRPHDLGRDWELVTSSWPLGQMEAISHRPCHGPLRGVYGRTFWGCLGCRVPTRLSTRMGSPLPINALFACSWQSGSWSAEMGSCRLSSVEGKYFLTNSTSYLRGPLKKLFKFHFEIYFKLLFKTVVKTFTTACYLGGGGQWMGGGMREPSRGLMTFLSLI